MGPGAILVKIIRKYDPEWGKKSDLQSKTNLTRNEFPNIASLPDDEIYRILYEKYHKNEIGNPKLRNIFHINFFDDIRTDYPVNRKRSFLFNDTYPGQTTHRAYLLYYSGVRREGTEILFYVGVSDAFEKLKITVIELNPQPGVGFIPRSIQLGKEE